MKIYNPTSRTAWFKPATAVLATTFLAFWSPDSRAAITVDYTGAIGQRDVITSTGAPAPDGYEVRIGYFATGFDVAGNANNIPALQGAFTQFDQTSITTLVGQPGRFTGSHALTNPGFDNRPISLWIISDSSPTPTEHGVFTSSASNWFFPVEGTVIPSTLVNSSEATTAVVGGLAAGMPGSLQLAQVPEPSTSLLLGGSLAALALFRRRK